MSINLTTTIGLAPTNTIANRLTNNIINIKICKKQINDSDVKEVKHNSVNQSKSDIYIQYLVYYNRKKELISPNKHNMGL